MGDGRPCFLAAVMDVNSRRIVGWAFGLDRTVNLTALAIQRAIRNRTPARALIFHSDRGIEYGAYHYRAILTKHGIRPSMNRPRCYQDNAHMESFFCEGVGLCCWLYHSNSTTRSVLDG